MELETHEERQRYEGCQKENKNCFNRLQIEEKKTTNIYITFPLEKGRNPHNQHNIYLDEELEMLMTLHIF